jgi:twitching motility protein PilJ
MSSYGLRVWIAIAAIAVIIFGANFFVANRRRDRKQRPSDDRPVQVLSQQLAKYSREAVSGNADSSRVRRPSPDRCAGQCLAQGQHRRQLMPGYEGGVNRAGVSSAFKKVTTIWTKMAGRRPDKGRTRSST